MVHDAFSLDKKIPLTYSNTRHSDLNVTTMTWSTGTVQLKQFTVVFFFFEAAVRREINATQCDTGLSLIFQSGNNGATNTSVTHNLKNTQK